MTAHAHGFACPETEAHARTVTDDDALGVVTAALSHVSGTELHIDRDARIAGFELTHQGSYGKAAHVTVCFADEPYGVRGTDFAVAVTRLHRCPSHVDTFLAVDGHCTQCIYDQVRNDS